MLRGVANASDLHLPHTCYRTDPSIFGRFCHEGDYCIDGVAYSCGLMGGVAHKQGAALERLARTRGYGSSDAHTCPLTDDIVRRGLNASMINQVLQNRLDGVECFESYQYRVKVV